jgi:predicted PhzF superfamily epimerase YddE/YHI9
MSSGPATGSVTRALAPFLLANKVMGAGMVIVEQGHRLDRHRRIGSA